MRNGLILRGFLLGALLLPVTSWGISKIGGGVQSDASEFQAMVPVDYQTISKSQQKFLMLESIQGILTGHLMPDQLVIWEAADLHPEWTAMTRSQIAGLLASEGFKSINGSADPCASAFLQLKDSGSSLIVLWGPAKGAVIQASDESRLPATAQEFLSTLQLQPGACGWN